MDVALSTIVIVIAFFIPALLALVQMLRQSTPFFQVQMCSACMGRAAARGGAAGAGESTISKRDSGGNTEDET